MTLVWRDPCFNGRMYLIKGPVVYKKLFYFDYMHFFLRFHSGIYPGQVPFHIFFKHLMPFFLVSLFSSLNDNVKYSCSRSVIMIFLCNWCNWNRFLLVVDLHWLHLLSFFSWKHFPDTMFWHVSARRACFQKSNHNHHRKTHQRWLTFWRDASPSGCLDCLPKNETDHVLQMASLKPTHPYAGADVRCVMLQIY